MQDELGETALHAASGHGNFNVMIVLVQRGADVNSLTKVGGVYSSIVEDGMLSFSEHNIVVDILDTTLIALATQHVNYP